MRQIRNTCRDFMTGHTAFLTYLDQKLWWHNLDKQKNRCYLFQEDESDCGYGLIKQEPALPRYWLTGALAPGFRDRGLGRHLFQYLIDECEGLGEVWLEVREDNVRARALYDKLGFQPAERPEIPWTRPGIITMRWIEPCPS